MLLDNSPNLIASSQMSQYRKEPSRKTDDATFYKVHVYGVDILPSSFWPLTKKNRNFLHFGGLFFFVPFLCEASFIGCYSCGYF